MAMSVLNVEGACGSKTTYVATDLEEATILIGDAIDALAHTTHESGNEFLTLRRTAIESIISDLCAAFDRMVGEQKTGGTAMSAVLWREVETELVRYFRSCDAEVHDDSGEIYVTLTTSGFDSNEVAVSLTELAHVLARELSGVL
jgi:hypothetical protein